MYRAKLKKFKARAFLHSKESGKAIFTEVKMSFIPTIGMKLVLDFLEDDFIILSVKDVIWDESEPRWINLLCGLVHRVRGKGDGNLVDFPYGLLPSSLCQSILEDECWETSDNSAIIVSDVFEAASYDGFDPREDFTVDDILFPKKPTAETEASSESKTPEEEK